jgi:hypothetical protein
MSPEPINKFLSKWETLPSGGDDCLSHEYLVELSKGRGKPAWLNHTKSCEQCSEILGMLGDQRIRKSVMEEFINQKNENAEVVSSHSRSLWAYLRALLTINQPRWSTAAFAASLILLAAFGYLSYKLEFKGRQQQPGIVYLAKDDYSYAVETLQVATESLPKFLVPTQKRHEQIAEINKNVLKVNDSIGKVNELYKAKRIQNDQRGQFSSLLVNYNSKLTPLRQDLAAGQAARSTPIPDLGKTPDTESVANVLTAVGRAMSKKNTEPDLEPTELKRAEAILSAFRQVEVLSIDDDASSKVFTLKYRSSTERSDAETAALENSVNLMMSKRNISVKILATPKLATGTGTSAFTKPQN